MPSVSFSVARLSRLSFFSPLCRLAAQRLPRSWPRHGWPFLPCARIIKNEESRREQEQNERPGRSSNSSNREEKSMRIGRTFSLLFYPQFLSIHLSLSHALPRTDIPAAYFENDWTRFVSRHVPVYFSLFLLCSLESRQFRRQQTRPVFSSFSHPSAKLRV